MRKYRGTSDLRPEFDSRGSFYGKATIVDFDNGDKVLSSYGTDILNVTLSGELTRMVDYDCISNTTARHCKEFIQQFARVAYDDLPGETTKEKVMKLPLYEEEQE